MARSLVPAPHYFISQFLKIKLKSNQISLGLIIVFLLNSNFVYSQGEVVKKESSQGTYYIYLPSSYNSTEKYPLIIAFHWSNARGQAIIEKWKEQAEKKGYIVACPNSKNPNYWDIGKNKEESAVFEMLRVILQEYRIDESRIYLTGFSSGATYSLYFAVNYPQKFKAAAAFAGSLRWLENSKQITLDSWGKIPIMIIQGDEDGTIPLAEGVYASDKLMSFGYKVKYKELFGVTHWYPDFVSELIMDWFEENK